MGCKRIFDATGEEESISKSVPKPQFKYYESLNMWLVMPDGRTYQIGTADIQDLIAYLAGCSSAMKQKITRRDLLEMLEDDSSSECRFYCLLEFKHYKCPMKIFSTEQEAKASQMSYNEDRC